MLFNIIPILVLGARLCDATVYDRYTGVPASPALLSHFDSMGVKDTCTMDVKPCDPHERRRVDGSCNNLKNPVAGTYFEPVYRVLPGHYHNGNQQRKSIDGSDLKLPRVVRNLLLCEGKSQNLEFTQAVPGLCAFSFSDVASIHDMYMYLENKTDCCTEEGMKSPRCSPNIIPEDDPVHRWSGIRCLNLTTPLIYSDFGCTDDPEPSPIAQATATFDLSEIYNGQNNGDEAVRCFEGGKLAVEYDEHGVMWPPHGDQTYCGANQPGETRCLGEYASDLLSSDLFLIWHIRHHNFLADGLAKVNPCWDDETLFQTARDINIAFAAQVHIYEWGSNVIGRENLIKRGVISDCDGYRDVYDENLLPKTSLEYSYILRWFHTMQEGAANMYDADGTFIKEYPYSNLTFRPGFLAVENNIKRLTQHIYRQACAAVDDGVDPDLSQNALPYIQKSADTVTSDCHKCRLLGFAPYIDYVNFCTGHKIESFEDLAPHMENEKIEKMKKAYNYVEDIDLIAGLWTEKLIEGGSIPATLACLIMEFFHRVVRSDRHWYERSQRPYAFTKDQLAEVRKSTLSQMLCNVADTVSEIQPNAFRLISSENPLKPCSEIPTIDFSKWADPSCTTSDTANDSRDKCDHANTKSYTSVEKSSSNLHGHSKSYGNE